jgi:hypothetical protein
MKKNFVIYLSVTDSPKFISGRRMVVQITRQGIKRKSKQYVVAGASRRRMLRVLEAME